MRVTEVLRSHLWAIGFFLCTCAIGYGARWAIGDIYSSAEATDLIQALSRAGLYLASAIVTAAATTLALMLTLIGMLKRMESEFNEQTYRDVDLIALLASFTMASGLAVLLAFTLPVGEFDTLPPRWYIYLYEGMFAATVLTVAMFAATVAILYRTVRRVIKRMTPGREV
ncbi:hypothetical protein [Qipengyuania atrilutea]|uniref:Uncharacterized protein n=1 Tax=Qipengyuania atrilutea TaxID=2744473 RepID=A0A850HEC2_9SPHN|nr:hypothetical protein [Actirhodobacter atriluteus]NVD45559.1 hypothetical protein [Actirhodobacter atriluteus]